MAPAPIWLQANWVIGNFGQDQQNARETYRQFVANGISADSPWESLRGQIWLGGDTFRQRMSRMVEEQDLREVPTLQAHPERPSNGQVLSAVAKAFDISREKVVDRSHQPAFKTAVYLLRRACNTPLAQAARIAGISASRVSRIQAEIEKSEPTGCDSK
jgi:hypothetical protein